MDSSPPGSSVHGISQARILEGLPFPSPGNLPDLGIEPATHALAGRFFTTESPGKPGLDAEETLKNLLFTDPGHMCHFGEKCLRPESNSSRMLSGHHSPSFWVTG